MTFRLSLVLQQSNGSQRQLFPSSSILVKNKKPDEAILAFIRLHFRLTQESNRADLKQNKKPPDAFTAGGL